MIVLFRSLRDAHAPTGLAVGEPFRIVRAAAADTFY